MTLSIQSIREQFLSLKAALPDVEVAGTLELIGSSFIADEPTIFGAVNEEYVESELEWYLSMSLDVNDIKPKVPTIWRAVADANGLINSNYGFLLFHADNGLQYANVFDKLTADPTTRQAVAIYTRPTMHDDWNRNGRSDFVCTNAVNYYLRDGALHAVVQMRSNDVVFGYRNDYAWQRYVLNMLADDLGVEPGQIIWQAGSLHVYARHYHLITE